MTGEQSKVISVDPQSLIVRKPNGELKSAKRITVAEVTAFSDMDRASEAQQVAIEDLTVSFLKSTPLPTTSCSVIQS
jgi:hypothetical protein